MKHLPGEHVLADGAQEITPRSMSRLFGRRIVQVIDLADLSNRSVF